MSNENPIIRSSSDDPAMEQASLRARQTFRFFWREVSWERRRIVPGLDVAAVKGAFSDPPAVRSKDPGALEVEHMWLSDVYFDGLKVTGTLLNSPHSLRSVKEGDEVAISGKQIGDWMYAVSGKVYGGFTVDLMRSRMGKSERKGHDQAWGLDFGTVGVVNVVPPEFLGEKPAKQGFLSKLFPPKETQQDYAALATQEHPMSVNMRSSLEDLLKKNPAMIHEPNDYGYTYLHQFALAGSWDGVDVCLRAGDDPKRAAPNGMTPLKLAKSLGWTRVIARLEEAGAV